MVTGASRGIGLATACILASMRVPVVLVARSGKALDRTSVRLREGGARVELVEGDVADETVARRAVEAACAHAPLAALVNNAAVLDPIASLRTLDAGELRRHLDVNVVGVANGMRAALCASAHARTLRIVNVSSGAAVRATAGLAAYSASKAAVNALTAIAAVEEPGVVVTAMAPGTVETAMQRHLRGLSSQQFPAVADFLGLKEQGRLAHAIDASVAIVWLALAAPSALSGRFLGTQDVAEPLAAWRRSEPGELGPSMMRARAWFEEMEGA